MSITIVSDKHYCRMSNSHVEDGKSIPKNHGLGYLIRIYFCKLCYLQRLF